MNAHYIKKREALGQFIKDNQGVVLFSGQAPKASADGQYEFRVNKNFYYLTGLTRENFVLYLKKKEGKLLTKLFIEPANYDVEKWHGRKLSKESAIEISGIENVAFVESFKDELAREIYSDEIDCLAFDLEKLSFDEEDTYAHKFAKAFNDRYFYIPVTSIHPMMVRLRMEKQGDEIEKMEKAIEDTRAGIENILEHLAPGRFEYQVQNDFDGMIRQRGAKRNSFSTIAASGKDAVILHYVENDKPVEDGDLILLDLGSEYEEYCADISRTFPVNGKFTKRQKEIYDLVLKAQEEVIALMTPGTPFAKLNEKCREVLGEGLVALGVMDTLEDLDQYYYHGVSHHLGLDTHDISFRKSDLKPGMVLTCEPGLYIEKEGIGIRIEDDILVTEEGPRNLSKAILKTTEEIEAFMKK